MKTPIKKAIFNTISFCPSEPRHLSYFPLYMEDSGLWEDLKKLPEVQELLATKIPLGSSRYGGSIVDFPVDLNYPSDPELIFAAQLNLTDISPFDLENRLPKKGHLYFFLNFDDDIGKVIFHKGETKDLQRIFLEDKAQYWNRYQAISNFKSDTEKWHKNFRKLDTEELKCPHCKTTNFMDCNCDITGHFWHDRDDVIGKEYIWEAQEDNLKSKLFGIYSNEQMHYSELEEVTFSDKIVLLQLVGNYNEDGVFSVLINKTDLENENFERCEVHFSST